MRQVQGNLSRCFQAKKRLNQETFSDGPFAQDIKTRLDHRKNWCTSRCSTQIRSIHEMEELKRAQELRVDELR